MDAQTQALISRAPEKVLNAKGFQRISRFVDLLEMNDHVKARGKEFLNSESPYGNIALCSHFQSYV